MINHAGQIQFSLEVDNAIYDVRINKKDFADHINNPDKASRYVSMWIAPEAAGVK